MLKLDSEKDNDKINLTSKNLNEACEKGLLEEVNYFIKQAIFNLQSDRGIFNKSLRIASKKGFHKIVDLLLKSNANVDSKNEEGKTALHEASENARDEEARNTTLHEASSRGYDKVVELLINAKANLNIKDQDGKTGLHRACFWGNHKIVELLINGNADVNIMDNDGYTGLHIASTEGHDKIVEELINAKANLNITDTEGFTAIHLASRRGHEKIVKLLVNAKADLNIKNKRGETALHRASYWGFNEIVKLLLIENACVDVKDNYGTTPLDIANLNGRDEIVKLLGIPKTVDNIIDLNYNSILTGKCSTLGAVLESEFIDLIIPPDAVENQTIFWIKECKSMKFSKTKRLSHVYEIGPHGEYFKNPIKIRFKKVKSKMQQNICLIKHQFDDKYFDISAVYFPTKIEQQNEQELIIEFELKNFSFFYLGDFQTPLKFTGQTTNHINDNVIVRPGLNICKFCSFGYCNGYKTEHLEFRVVTNSFAFNKEHCPNTNCDRNLSEKIIFYKSIAEIRYKIKGSETEMKTTIEADEDSLMLVGNKDHIVGYSSLTLTTKPNGSIDVLNDMMSINCVELQSIFENNSIFSSIEALDNPNTNSRGRSIHSSYVEQATTQIDHEATDFLQSAFISGRF